MNTDSSNNQFADSPNNQNEFDRLSRKLHNKYIGIEPMLLIAAIALLIVYYYIFSSLGNNEEGEASGIKSFFETMLWIFFIVLLLLNGISYIFGIDIIKVLKKMLGYKTVSLTDNPDKDNLNIIDFISNSRPQVFQLSDKKYSYDDARAACAAYDAKLANYDDVTDAFNNGGDWCNYGWSEGQMALFPTQQEKWDILQKMPGHEKECGHPGVNGGYIDNASLTFGANCFGSKPAIKNDDAQEMQKKPLYVKSEKEIAFDKQVNYWRNNLSQIEVAPFNHNNWSML